MPATYSTVPGNILVGSKQFIRRNPTDNGWEAYNTVSAADLDFKADLEDGKVPASQLPSFVDDVESYAALESFPEEGEIGKIYVAEDSNKVYRWTGTSYIEINPSLALGETAGSAYRGDRGKTAYDHSQQVTGNPHNVTKSDVGLSDVDNTSDADKPISTAAQAALDSKVDTTSLADVAFSADYGDLNNRPDIPTVKRQETYLGTSDQNGNYTVEYDTPFSSTPDVQPQLQPGSATDTRIVRITASSGSGFTVNVRNRTDVIGLLPSYSNVPGASVGVLVTER